MKINVEANYIKYILMAIILLIIAWIVFDWDNIVKCFNDANNSKKYISDIENTY